MRSAAQAARTLAFERMFLDRYCPYLLAELASGDVAREVHALQALSGSPLLDDEVIASLRHLETDEKSANPKRTRLLADLLRFYERAQAGRTAHAQGEGIPTS